MEEGRVHWRVPGEGRLDLEANSRALVRHGLNVFVTVEISAQIWCKDDDDRWDVAQRSCDAMRAGMERAGVA